MTTLFGATYAAPFGIPPFGSAALCAYRGDIVLARAAAAANVPMILSAASLIKLEDVRRANPAAWYQAYLAGDASRIERDLGWKARTTVEELVRLMVDADLAR